MLSLNRVQVIGYQTQPVEIRQTPTGTSVTDLNIMAPTMITTANGENVIGKSFLTVTLWGSMADIAGQFVRAGSQVFLAGRLQTDSWEDDQSGEKRSKTKMVALDLILLDSKSGQDNPPAGIDKTLPSLNRADIIGNVTRDPEVRTTTSGQTVLTLGIATNERWRDKAANDMKERTEFHNVVVWGDLAQEVAKTIKKGSRVYATGRVQSRSFETQAGSKRSVTEVVADGVSLLGLKSELAAESMRADTGFAGNQDRQNSPADVSQDNGDKEPAFASVPDIQYKSDVKVEDLPF